MKLAMLCFSPTGGTKRVAKVVADVWQEPVREIDLSDSSLDFASYSFAPDDVCLIAVPSFGGRVPSVVVERLALIQGNKASAILVVVYGNRAYEDTLLELADVAKASGFRIVAGVAGVAEHSIMHQFATGRPDEQDTAKLHSFAQRIHDALEQGEVLAEPQVPGNRPYRDFGGVPFVPKAGKACTTCGVCAQRCPVGAIPSDNPASTNKDLCIACMRCVAVCPADARKLNRALLEASGLMLKKVCSVRKENELFLAEKTS